MGPALTPAAPPAVLVYDGECPMCRASALWVMRLALSGGALEILPCRSEPRRARFPQISDTACMEAMQLVLPDGRVLAGADAVPELLRRIRGTRLARDGCLRCPARVRSRAGFTPGSRGTGCGSAAAGRRPRAKTFRVSRRAVPPLLIKAAPSASDGVGLSSPRPLTCPAVAR